VTKVKKEHIILIIVFLCLITVSLWMSTQANVQEIEKKLTGEKTNRGESGGGIIEGGNILLYLALVVILIVIGITGYYRLSREKE
jgi:hypothetical protein